MYRPCVKMDLTPNIMEQIIQNVAFFSESLSNREKLISVLKRLNFDTFMNVNIRDDKNLSFCIEFLRFLTRIEEFYGMSRQVKGCVEFFFLNLAEECSERGKLLSIFFKILSHLPEKTWKEVSDTERLLKLLLDITDSMKTDRLSVDCCGQILDLLFEKNGCHYLAYNANTAQIFDNFKKHDAIPAMCMMCGHLLKRCKILNENFDNVYNWLTKESFLILNNHQDQNLVLQTLQCFNLFYDNYTYISKLKKYEGTEVLQNYHDLSKKLMKTSSDICIHSQSKCREDCLKLLEHLLTYFLAQEDILSTYQKNEVAKTLHSFSEDYETWPKTKNELFLHVCHLVVYHSRLLWKPSDVLNLITYTYYSRGGFLPTNLMKSTYFLFPVMAQYCDEFHQLGCDLLISFSPYATFFQLYSYSTAQLMWILMDGPVDLKMNALKFWLANEKVEHELISAIKTCSKEKIILKFLIMNFADSGFKASHLIRKLNNAKLSIEIALKLPSVVQQPALLNCLLMADPGVPANINQALLICTLMGVVIPSLTDHRILRRACIYSAKLLSSLQKTPSVVEAFCRNFNNIKFLLPIVQTADDETSITIIRLFKILMIFVQKDRTIKLKGTIVDEFRWIGQGSLKKVQEGLKLFSWTIARDNSFIMINTERLPVIFSVITQLTAIYEISELSFNTLIMFLKINKWLASSDFCTSFLEEKCMSLPDNCVTIKCTLDLVEVWLKIMKCTPYVDFCEGPYHSIKSFVNRVPNINRMKREGFLKDLEYLSKKAYGPDFFWCTSTFRKKNFSRLELEES